MACIDVLLLSALAFCLVVLPVRGATIVLDDDIQNFVAKQNTFCSGGVSKANMALVACRLLCKSDEKCLSFSHDETALSCTLQGASSACGSKTGVTTYYKDTRCSSVPESSVLNLQCAKGSIISEVVFAGYGTPTGICGAFKSGTCDQGHVREMVEDLCIGEPSCQVSASSQLFGEPCPLITKNLRVQVKCEASQTFNEDHYFNEWSSRFWPAAAGEMETRKSKITSLLAALPAYPATSFAGRGIIIVAGGKYLESALVQVKMLRAVGCVLRIQVWHLGAAEMNSAQATVLATYKVETRDFTTYVSPDLLAPIQANVGLRLFQLKPLAILHSDLAEVLLLDSDNVPLRDPSFLFDTVEFRNAGSVFWPDFWTTSQENPIWKVMGLPPSVTWEQESGQLLINKVVAWRALNLCVHLNDEFYMRLLNGDKDTFRFAWLAAGVPFHMIEHWPISVGTMKETHSEVKGFCGHSMLQRDMTGAPLFLHHNQLKNFHLPQGTNFQHMKAPAPGTKFRAVPVKGLQTPSGPVISCVDVQGPGLSDVDSDLFPAESSNLAGFETKYFNIKASIPAGLFAAVDTHADVQHPVDSLAAQSNSLSSTLREKLKRADGNTTCTAAQFELEAPTISNDRLCETITPCDAATQTLQTPPTASADRVCVALAGVVVPGYTLHVRVAPKNPTHPTFSVPGPDLAYEVQNTPEGTFIQGAALTLTRYTRYDFSMASQPGLSGGPFPLIITLDNVGGSTSLPYLDGVTSNSATGIVTFVPSAAAPSMLYYHASNVPDMGWRITVRDPVFTVAHQGNYAGNPVGTWFRFSTALSPAAHLFTITDESGEGKFGTVRAECEASCAVNSACQGVFVYRLAYQIVCYGLSDVSGSATPTLTYSQSLLKTV